MFCLDFPSCELFLKPSKEEGDDIRLFPHIFCSLSRSSFCHSCFGSLFFSLLLLLFTRHDFSLFPCAVFGTICQTWASLRTAGVAAAELSSGWLLEYLPIFPARFGSCSWVSAATEVLLSVSHLANRRPVGLHLQGGRRRAAACRYTLSVNVSGNRGLCRQILWR